MVYNVEVVITSTRYAMKAHIHVGPEKNGIKYAEIYTPQRLDGKKVNNPQYLGKVVDLNKGIFYSKKRGFFKYTIDNGYETNCDTDYKAYSEGVGDENSILDFGSVYLLE